MAEFEILASVRTASNQRNDVVEGGPQMSRALAGHEDSQHSTAADVAKAALLDKHLLFDNGAVFDLSRHVSRSDAALRDHGQDGSTRPHRRIFSRNVVQLRTSWIVAYHVALMQRPVIIE